jgi:type II secretory pathway pseudopilin PulG
MVIILSIAIGVVLTSLIGLVQQLKLRSRIRKLEHSLAQATAAAERQQPDQPPQ